MWVLDGKSGLLKKIEPGYGVVARLPVTRPNPFYDLSRAGTDPVSVAAGLGVGVGDRRLAPAHPRRDRRDRGAD